MTDAVSPAATAIAAGQASAASGAAAAGLADNFDSFLKLLTTQLANQDPLSPLDTDQFTRQLVQFTGVEQTIKTNAMLEDLVGLVRADRFARGIDYLGAEVEARGETVRLGADGAARLQYQLPQAAAEVAIRVENEAGQTVFVGRGETAAGRHGVPWDGRDLLGNRLPEGLYRVEVKAADAAGGALPVTTTIDGMVDGIEMRGDQLLFSVDGVLVAEDAITRLRRAQSEA